MPFLCPPFVFSVIILIYLERNYKYKMQAFLLGVTGKKKKRESGHNLS